MEPYLEKYSESYNENIVYSKINVDKKQLYPVMIKYGVKSMPTFILLPIGSIDVPTAYPNQVGFDPNGLEKIILFHNQ